MAAAKNQAPAQTPGTESKAKKEVEVTEEQRKRMSLLEKFVAIRRACPEIERKRHNGKAPSKYIKLSDIWEYITPALNAFYVDFAIQSEEATHCHEGDPQFFRTMDIVTSSGPALMWVYEADLTIVWTNVDNPDEAEVSLIHAAAWNNDPATAKNSAHTYALKGYLSEKFSIRQVDDDEPDPVGAAGRSHGKLTDAQLNRLYRKAEDAGMSKAQVNARIKEKYGYSDPAELGRKEYDDICGSLDQAIKGGK